MAGEPYYEDELVTLYLGDALELWEKWCIADVLCVDPPYGIDYNSGMESAIARSIEGDKDTAVRDGILALWGDKPALVFGSPKIEKPAGWQMTLIWDKKGALGMGDLRIPWKPGHEEIYVLGANDHWRGQRTNDVISCAPVQSMAKNGRVHPHQKPLRLMQELVEKLPYGVVADPTAGSGTTLLAAASLGQRAIGVESDEQWIEGIAERLSTRQPVLA